MSLCKFLFTSIIIFLLLIIINKKLNTFNYDQLDNTFNYDQLDNTYTYNYDQLGDTYFYGTKYIDQDYLKALDYYKKVFIYDPYNKNITNIRKNINTIQNNTLHNNNHIIINNNDEYLYNDINDHIIDYNNNIEYNQEIYNLAFDDGIDINYQIYELNNNENNNFNENNNLLINNDQNFRIENDLQNVHDSVINKTINSSIKKLKETTIQNNELSDINKFIFKQLKNSNFNKEDKNKITKTVNYIQQNQTLPIDDYKLKDNLILIGNRIINHNDKNKQQNMIHNLLYELKECIRDDGNLYCTKGISNRIVDSLNGIDEMVVITPKWAIHEEMMNKSGVIRNELEKVKSVDDEDFSNKLKEKIKTELKKEYVEDNNILSEHDFNKELDEWIEYV